MNNSIQNRLNHTIKPILCLFYLLLIIEPSGVQAQAGNEIFRHITPRDGLQNTFVWDMIQDRHGFIWIAGTSGLNRYDGYTVTNFLNDPDNTASLTAGAAFKLYEDEQGHIWIGTGFGLSIFNPADETFIQVQLDDTMPPLRNVRALKKATNGALWLGTANGIYLLPAQSLSSPHLQADYFEIDSSEHPFTFISSIETDGTEYLWVGTDAGVFRYNTTTRQLSKPGPFNNAVDHLLSRDIWTLLIDRNNNLWISSDEGLGVWYEGDAEPQVITDLGDGKLNLEGRYMQSVVETPDGNLWVGTSDLGAFKFNPVTGELLAAYRHEPGNPNSISEDDVHFVFEDIDGNVWFGYHFVGLTVMYTQPWNYSYNLISEAFDGDNLFNFTHMASADESENLWITTHRGLVKIPGNGGRHQHFLPVAETADYDSLDNQLVMLFKDSRYILTNSHSGNYYRFELSTERFQKLELPEGFTPFFRPVDGTHHYLLGSLGVGSLLLIDKNSFSIYTIEIAARESEFIQQRAVIPLRDAGGNIYIRDLYLINESFDWDYYSFDEESQELARIVLSAPDNVLIFGAPFTSPHEPGVIWSRTNRGILREDLIGPTSRLLFQSESGMINEANNLGVEDKDGNIWLGSRTGILRLNPETEVLTYFESDPDRRPITFINPYQLPDGDILFMGYGGYTRFDPDELADDPVIHNIHITELIAGENLFNILYGSGEYKIDYGSNNLSFTFLGLNYRDPAMTRYRYRLIGYQDDWIEVGTQRRIFLANLPPGNYSFQVQAGQRYGSYSDALAEVQFSILPPWWRTLPAYIFFTIIFTGGLFVVDRVQRRRLISKERERTREKELEQAREIEKAYKNLKAAQEQLVQQEKLASLGQLTAGIAHEIKNPLNFVNNFSDLCDELMIELQEELKQGNVDEALIISQDIAQNLKKIHMHGSRADGIVKSMLMHSRGGDGKMEPSPLNPIIKEYVNLTFHGMRASKDAFNVDIQLDLDETIGEVPLVAEDFSRVILNLCNNAFDAMREKQTGDGRPKTKPPLEGGSERSEQGDASSLSYHPKLTVRTHQSENGTVTIEIEDNGPGIPEDIKDKILQPFFTTKKGTQGTGLGLSITNDIVKAHGGTISIKTRQGSGTTFTIELMNK
ncbi:MAG: hypothetical protein EA359_16060 [Balneolaceae bacterium]|nr:MAG: hypothetical protein EA359_16060 [Balneolaceae bacterium]